MRRFVLPWLLVAVVAAGCGGDDDGGRESSTTLDVSMVEFEFDPTTFVVPAGEEITLNLSNAGSVEHEFALLNAGTQIEAEADFEESMVYFEAELEPGDSGTFTFTAPDEGSYQVVCVIPGHFTAGMEGQLQSTAG